MPKVCVQYTKMKRLSESDEQKKPWWGPVNGCHWKIVHDDTNVDKAKQSIEKKTTCFIIENLTHAIIFSTSNKTSHKAVIEQRHKFSSHHKILALDLCRGLINFYLSGYQHQINKTQTSNHSFKYFHTLNFSFIFSIKNINGTDRIQPPVE